MERKVSIKDIARHLGVSTALVSYVLNNKADRVGAEMAEKIRQAAIQLNYRPNLIARSLQSGKTNTLGLIVADISNPFFSHIARIIEDEAKRSGYTVIFGSNDESVEKSQALLDAFLNRQVDALIIAPAEFTEEFPVGRVIRPPVVGSRRSFWNKRECGLELSDGRCFRLPAEEIPTDQHHNPGAKRGDQEGREGNHDQEHQACEPGIHREHFPERDIVVVNLRGRVVLHGDVPARGVAAFRRKNNRDVVALSAADVQVRQLKAAFTAVCFPQK